MTHIPKRVTLGTGLTAIALMEARSRLRSVSNLASNPLAILMIMLAVVSYVWALVQGGQHLTDSEAADSIHDDWTLWALYGYGLLLFLVALTAQRGSPLRWQLADVWWVLQSRAGPRVAVLFHSLQSAVMALVGSSLGAAVALVLRGHNPSSAVTSGSVVAAAVLLLRSVSLFSHLIGRRLSKRLRSTTLVLLAFLATLWTLSFVNTFLDNSTPVLTKDVLIYLSGMPHAIFTPESGLPALTGAIGVAAAILTAYCLKCAHEFIEPGVLDSLLSRQLAQVLSGRRSSPATQGRGFRTGLESWQHWPTRATPSLITAHWAQTRRRAWSVLASLVVYLLIAPLPWLLQGKIPHEISILLILGVMASSSPAQFITVDLSRQHLLLASVPTARLAFLGTLSNSVLDFLSVFPALVMWCSLYYGAPGATVAFMPVLLSFCVMTSVIGAATPIFTSHPVGRAVAGTALALWPVLTALSSLIVYSDGRDYLRAALTLGGTCLVALLLYSGMYWARLLTHD